ncbi:hypothetical protein SAMN04488021_16411 [Paracoccus aminovorans]|uniref:Uncharacterized protein n=2 Tax=Paracoccus aminovorans TaxID=34004 RepID=A0A1I3F8Q3_9RHOB|nr:hypothetical protein JCM7685_2803 [Paracoccus aminovorans]SFI07530.1 hypothetical protein SAMN04488021_16411 [Paracoccus aminovorans]
MTLSFDASARPTGRKSQIQLDAPLLGASTLTFLKPRLKTVIRPLAAKFAGMGITANQVTLASLAVLGLIIAMLGGLPAAMQPLPPLLYGGLILTIWNRLRFVVSTRADCRNRRSKAFSICG